MIMIFPTHMTHTNSIRPLASRLHIWIIFLLKKKNDKDFEAQEISFTHTLILRMRENGLTKFPYVCVCAAGNGLRYKKLILFIII